MEFQEKIYIFCFKFVSNSGRRVHMLKKYFKTKPIQVILMLLVLAWSVYEIGATSLASNSSLTKEAISAKVPFILSDVLIFMT